MRYCSACGHQHSDGVDLCSQCGAALERSCPACGQLIPAESNFCSQCGALLAESPAYNGTRSLGSQLTGSDGAAPAAQPLESSFLPQAPGERRDVSVLFVDVVNFTAAAHQLDTEDVYLLVDEAMRLLVGVVHQYDGSVDKFTGDGLMALFGAPFMHENDPERAVRVALDMLNALQPLQARTRQKYGFDLNVRIGINTGPVIAGQVGNDLYMEYTVIGNTVNLAARLQTAAEPDTILVSQETFNRTRHLFSFDILPLLSLKGLPEPMPVFRPLGLREKPDSVRGLPGLHTPLIGRAKDLAQLREAWLAVCEHSQRQIILITGEAGLGKSRLVAEFLRIVGQAEVQVYQGSCMAYARSASLWVVADLLRNILGLSESDSPSHQRAALELYLEQFELTGEAILPYLANLLGTAPKDPAVKARLDHLDATMLQRQTHAALRQLFLALARRGPLVLIFEDLHWVDPASRSFLEYLIQTTNDTPLLLILISRDAERETAIRPLIAAAEQDPTHLVDLQLQALSEPAGELLVEQLIPQSTAEARLLKKRIAGRAEGNPFYAEEIIRMLVDQGGLIGETGAWQVTPKAIELLGEVPDTVKGLVLARFDRLPEALRQTLQKAAVLGMSFPVSLLQLLNGVGAHALTVQLGELVARQFLVNISLGSGQGYTFRHALIQEAIYGTLLKRDQQIIHMRVAQAVEQGTFLPPEEKVQMLAYHYAESTCPSQALPYLITAADNAARRCAYETAVDHYRRAMALLPDKPDEDAQEFFQVRIGLGRALKFLGEFTTASQILAETLYWLWGWSLQVAPAAWPILVDNLRELADVRQREGAYNEALVYLEAGLHILDRSNATEVFRLRCSLLDRMAWIRFRQGQLEEAFALASKATEDLRAQIDHSPILLASLYNTLGGICWQRAQLAEAITYVERSLAIYKNLGYLWGMGIAHGNLGVLWDDQGNWPKAASYYRQAYTFNQMMGELQNQAGNLDNLGALYMAMGRHDAARRELETALRIRQQLGDNWGMAQSQVNLAHLALVQANFDETATFAAAALSLAEAIGSSDIQVHARWILALVRAEKESPQAGLAYAEETLQIAQAAGPLDEEANCYRVLGVLHARAGRYDTAETLLVQSIDLSIQLNNPYLQALALLELGRVYQALAEFADLSDSQWPARATDSLTQAVELFESLGAMHDLKLARTAAHHLPH